METTTFGALLDDWLAHGDAADRSPTTMHGYRVKAKVIREALGSIQLADLTARDLDTWYGRLRKKGVSAAQVRAYHRIVSAALRKGKRWGAVPASVAEDAEPPRVDRHDIRPPTAAQVDTLIRVAHASKAPEMAGIIKWGALTGMRRGEICGLRWHDVVDWEAGTVMVRRSYYSVPGSSGEKDTKTHQTRELSVSPEAMSVLLVRSQQAKAKAAELGLQSDRNGYVWCSDFEGKEPYDPDRITQAFNRFCRKAEEPALKRLQKKDPEATRAELPLSEQWPFRFHDLRHFFATELLEAFSAVVVGGLLGHERTSTTNDIYGHGREPSARAAANHIGSLLRNPTPDLAKPQVSASISAPQTEGLDPGTGEI